MRQIDSGDVASNVKDMDLAQMRLEGVGGWPSVSDN